MPTIKDYFQNIATAIKQKNSEIVTVTPAQMPQAILDIPSGGGGDFSFETPLHFDNTNGYVNVSGNTGTYTYSPNQLYLSDVYKLTQNHLYILTLGNTRGNRFRVAEFASDPNTALHNQTGAGVVAVNDPTNRTIVKLPYLYDYLVVTKDVSGVTGIKTYLIDCTEWS